MRTKTRLLTLCVLMALAVSAGAQTTNLIPRDTVVPVILDNSLSSATAFVGQRFFSHCSGSNCGGFPTGTVFTGEITSVIRHTGRTPGQISVRFIQARLPDGRVIPINGSLISMSSNDVRVDPNTGLLVATASGRRLNSKFIGYGAGAGFVIGALTRGNLLVGTLIGAALGYLYGATLGRTSQISDVNVPAGTRVGILLNSGVNMPKYRGAGTGYAPPPVGGGPVTGPGPFTVTYTGVRPFTAANGAVMVPMRQTLDAIEMPFAVNTRNRRVIVDTYSGELVHPVGTNIAYVNGQTQYLSAPSRYVNGVLFVPSDFINIATGLSTGWNPNTGTLVIK